MNISQITTANTANDTSLHADLRTDKTCDGMNSVKVMDEDNNQDNAPPKTKVKKVNSRKQINPQKLNPCPDSIRLIKGREPKLLLEFRESIDTTNTENNKESVKQTNIPVEPSNNPTKECIADETLSSYSQQHQKVIVLDSYQVWHAVCNRILGGSYISSK